MSEPSIERMIQDLLGGGWEKVTHDTWRSPWGAIYRGPHKAWHVWAGTPMCDPNSAAARSLTPDAGEDGK